MGNSNRNSSEREVVGRMGMAEVVRLPSEGFLWTEYSHRTSKYRSDGGSILMKQVIRTIDHFDETPLGAFNELIENATKDLHGVHVIMKPTASLDASFNPRGGQLVVTGWTYDVSIRERDFFDELNSQKRIRA